MDGRLKKARAQKGLSQAAVAARVHISREAYALYESGKRQPNLETLALLAQTLEVTSDYLLGLTDCPQAVYGLTEPELQAIRDFRSMDSRGQDTLRFIMQEQLRYRVPEDSGEAPGGL